MPHFSLRLAAAALALALATPAAQAATVTVNLDLAPFATGTDIELTSSGYGSDGPVTVNWNPLNDLNRRLIHWNGGYSGRDGAYCITGIDCTLDLTVAAGFTVTLDSFWLGAYPNFDRSVTWSVIDLFDNSTVAGTVGALVSGLTGLTNTLNATSTAGFRIQFGPDGYNGGINDIVYSYARVDTPPPPPDLSPIPLPAAGWLLLGALAGLAGLRRRRG